MRYIVLALLFVVVISAAGYLALSQKRQPKETAPAPTYANSASANTHPTLLTQAPPQQITDEANLLTLVLPQNWKVIKEGPQGVRISGVQAESPDFYLRSDTEAEGPFTPVYYEEGAHLQISIQDDTSASIQKPAGIISEETPVSIDGAEGIYYSFKEPSTAKGQLHLVQLTKDGRSYYFRFGYNPETYPDGEKLFGQIIDSVTFTAPSV